MLNKIRIGARDSFYDARRVPSSSGVSRQTQSELVVTRLEHMRRQDDRASVQKQAGETKVAAAVDLVRDGSGAESEAAVGAIGAPSVAVLLLAGSAHHVGL